MKTLIVGAGALGGIIGARLLAAGASVSLATRNSTSPEEIKSSGLRVTGNGGDLSVEAREVAPLAEYSVPGAFDLIVLAMKAQDAIDVAPSLVRLLAPGGTLLPVQNGGVAQMLASQLGDECVLGGLSNLTGTMLRPGIYEQSNAGYEEKAKTVPLAFAFFTSPGKVLRDGRVSQAGWASHDQVQV
jgi:2-dehydropantoate 2-reductase